MKNKKSGFTLIEIMIVVIIIGLLAALAIPNFVRARKSAQRNSCLANLRQINGAYQQYFLEKGTDAGVPAIDAADIIEYFQTDELPKEPAGGTYNPPADEKSLPTCTIGVTDPEYPHAIGVEPTTAP